MSKTDELPKRLKICLSGKKVRRLFEDIRLEILTYVFVLPITKPKIQPRTYSGIDRQDAVFPNRHIDSDNSWGHLYKELGARMSLLEFKNFDSKQS